MHCPAFAGILSAVFFHSGAGLNPPPLEFAKANPEGIPGGVDENSTPYTSKISQAMALSPVTLRPGAALSPEFPLTFRLPEYLSTKSSSWDGRYRISEPG